MISKEEINQTAPSFLWLLRDAFLQPENSQGSPCTFLDYLLEKVNLCDTLVYKVQSYCWVHRF